jgi:Zn-dependent protease with chaperone function
MLFFEAQRKAKTKTAWLVLLFVINVIVVSSLNALLFTVTSNHSTPKKVLAVFLGSALFFVVMSIVATLTLPKGQALVESLGGRILSGSNDTAGEYTKATDLKEKQFLNVVEEMALASGVPIPHCAVLDGENSINAFIAGEEIQHIVVAVTRGALERLTRDELQAVIGHEFSHILNEDLSFNGKLAGVVQGFQIITKLGDLLTNNRRNRSHRNRFTADAIGLGLMAIGSFGYALGRLIQNLISRQREYLADSSSAQFTRNPEALARALGKILMGQGSAISASSRIEFAHIFFSDAVGTAFMSSLLSTHPPLRDRIQRLVPKLDLEEVLVQATANNSSSTADKTRGPKPIASQQWTSEKILACIGAPTEANFQLTQSLLSEYGPQSELLKKPTTARAALSLVVLYSQEAYQDGLPLIMEQAGVSKSDFNELRRLVEAGEQQRVVLFQKALAGLRVLSFKEKQELLQSLRLLFERDQKWSLLETMLFLVAEKILLSGKRSQVTVQQLPVSNLRAWFEQETSVDFKAVQEFLHSWDSAFLLRKKDLIQECLKFVDQQKSQSREEFRLVALWLGVPIPMYQ